ncbi:MAG: helix-hairpin-helix domain-containing protein [Pseudomonadales bacterium]|nr:helix-hairpin-helix domain-containing protein [Pseudomonadales bacterium]MCP5331170.1 helix-hairpin-helix domain-containing protein [Pseudomonadales bacterium]MCP5343634.1 helix-hairpin-helix domain-containing protein [Pseudomonadales bacterium]
MKRIFCCVALILSCLSPLAFAAQAPQNQDAEPPIAAKTQVDINKADAATLALALDGVGMAKAQDIIAHRDKIGGFKSLEDLEQVRGIGPATIARNRDRILISPKE